MTRYLDFVQFFASSSVRGHGASGGQERWGKADTAKNQFLNHFRYKLTIAYEGTAYVGWQVQPHGISIQALIQKALETIFRHPLLLIGAGRTDAGVHAQGQTAHFDTQKS